MAQSVTKTTTTNPLGVKTEAKNIAKATTKEANSFVKSQSFMTSKKQTGKLVSEINTPLKTSKLPAQKGETFQNAQSSMAKSAIKEAQSITGAVSKPQLPKVGSKGKATAKDVETFLKLPSEKKTGFKPYKPKKEPSVKPIDEIKYPKYKKGKQPKINEEGLQTSGEIEDYLGLPTSNRTKGTPITSSRPLKLPKIKYPKFKKGKQPVISDEGLDTSKDIIDYLSSKPSKGGGATKTIPPAKPKPSSSKPSKGGYWDEITPNTPQEPGGRFKINPNTGKSYIWRESPSNVIETVQPVTTGSIIGKTEGITTQTSRATATSVVEIDTPPRTTTTIPISEPHTV